MWAAFAPPRAKRGGQREQRNSRLRPHSEGAMAGGWLYYRIVCGARATLNKPHCDKCRHRYGWKWMNDYLHSARDVDDLLRLYLRQVYMAFLTEIWSKCVNSISCFVEEIYSDPYLFNKDSGIYMWYTHDYKLYKIYRLMVVWKNKSTSPHLYLIFIAINLYIKAKCITE